MIEGFDHMIEWLDPLLVYRGDHHAGHILERWIYVWYHFLGARGWIDEGFCMMLTIFRLSSFLREPPEDHQHATDIHGEVRFPRMMCSLRAWVDYSELESEV